MISAAYLIELRLNDAGKKATVQTELYYSGDSVGFYGRAYLSKGAFKGNIIEDYMTVYFPRDNEYYQGTLDDLKSSSECPGPGENLMMLLAMINGQRLYNDEIQSPPNQYGKREIAYKSGRFERSVKMKAFIRGWPDREMLIDPLCGDSVVIKYCWHDEDFPYYQIENILYYNEPSDFRVKGFVREQHYNISVPERKFEVVIPPDAVLLESF